ncbi:hypothetical protein GCM10023082_22600 [Streptomyces tremellae]|uniref:Uncharacterized protein n=1 Tax=Streptomyces tremellae TaxID=1124239 RepID=A0ABP7ETV8_9ACTN
MTGNPPSRTAISSSCNHAPVDGSDGPHARCDMSARAAGDPRNVRGRPCQSHWPFPWSGGPTGWADRLPGPPAPPGAAGRSAAARPAPGREAGGVDDVHGDEPQPGDREAGQSRVHRRDRGQGDGHRTSEAIPKP